MKNNSGAAINNYVDIVNRPGFLDSAAAGFAKQADRTPNLNKAQRRESGFLTGFAGGLQGAANQQRNSKLAEFDEIQRELALFEANLDLQQGAGELMKVQAANFTRSYTPEFLALNKALEADDQVAANNIMKLIATGAGQEIEGFRERYGDYSHAYNGQVFFTKDGKTQGYSNKELFSQLPFAEVLGDQAREIPLLLSNYTNQKFQQSDLLDSLNIEKQRADIAGKYAQTNLANAQTRGVDADTEAKRMEMQNPSPSPELFKDQREATKFNRELIRDKIEPVLKSNTAVLGTLESLEDVLAESPNLVGSDFKARAYRSFASSVGLDPNLDYANMKSVEFEKMLKPVLGAAFGIQEGERLLSKFPSTNTNPKALKKFLDEEIPRIAGEIITGQEQIAAYNQQPYVDIYNPSITQDVEAKSANFLQERKQARLAKKQNNATGDNYVVMTGPDGKQLEVPKDKVELFKQNGYN